MQGHHGGSLLCVSLVPRDDTKRDQMTAGVVGTLLVRTQSMLQLWLEAVPSRVGVQGYRLLPPPSVTTKKCL